MTLTCLEGASARASPAAAPHAYRRLGSGVLVEPEGGEPAWFSLAEHREALAGRLPLLSALPAGAWAGEPAAWRGPGSHSLFLSRAGREMGLSAARRIVDFVFASPEPASLELVVADLERAWPLVWFVLEYSARQGQWRRKPLRRILRTRAPATEKLEKSLSGHKAQLRLAVDLNGGPPSDARPGRADRILAVVGSTARDPKGWVDRLAASGAAWLRLDPAPELRNGPGVKRFLDFYGAALDRLISRQGMAEERAAAFLRARPWELPGLDVLSGLAYGPDGAIYTGEEGLESGEERLRLGDVFSIRYEDLGSLDAVRASLAACLPENQPLCFQCVYKSRCAVSPAGNLRLQGSFWGQTPSSPLCAMNMGILDLLFERLREAEARTSLERWRDTGSVDFFSSSW